MADPSLVLHPFRGIHYNFERDRDLSDLISPPYDVISERAQAELYARNEHNFVRIELTRAAADVRYTEAANALCAWLEEGVLVRENMPAMYLLEQEFSVGGRHWRRRGIFGAVRLPEPGQRYVLSHEGTLAGPKADRLNLMRACRAMTSPIMLMAEDGDGRLMGLLNSMNASPDAHARESDGVVDRLWVVSDEAAVEAVSGAIGRGPLYIADGHHRFETACTYRDEMRGLYPDAPTDAGFSHGLVLVNSARDEGLRIFPTHRLISGLDGRAKQELRQRMNQSFEVLERAVRSPEAVDLTWLDEPGLKTHVFGVYLGGGRLFRLTGQAATAAGSVVESLDVAVLHRTLVDPVLAGLGCASQERISHDSDAARPTAEGPRLTYTTDAAQAVAAVDRGDYDAAFFLRPTRVEEVIAAARAGERMPGKSTYFYPKIPAGLIVSNASEEPV